MRSWSKWKIFSRKCASSISVGPRAPCLRLFWSSATGMPCCVVKVADIAARHLVSLAALAPAFGISRRDQGIGRDRRRLLR